MPPTAAPEEPAETAAPKASESEVKALLDDGPPDMRAIASRLDFLVRDAEGAAATLARLRAQVKVPLDVMTPEEVEAALR